MAEHNLFGKEGEDMACEYLLKEGYEILERNYTYLHCEIDVIARCGDEVVVVEVKARSRRDYGEPFSFVDKKKIKNLGKAINKYMIDSELEEGVRFDIISIVKERGAVSLEHIKDAFRVE